MYLPCHAGTLSLPSVCLCRRDDSINSMTTRTEKTLSKKLTKMLLSWGFELCQNHFWSTVVSFAHCYRRTWTHGNL